MRKYLLNAGVLSAAASVLSVRKAAKKSPKDWRLALLWVSWGIGLALAIGAVNQRDDAVREDELERELKRAAKGKTRK